MEIMAKSELENWQKEDAERLMHIWKKFQAKEDVNQEEVADSLGWLNQSAFSQYINGVIKLNLKAVISFARYFGVEPKEISPTYADMIAVSYERGFEYLDAPVRHTILKGIAEDYNAGYLSGDDLVALADFAEYRKSKKHPNNQTH